MQFLPFFLKLFEDRFLPRKVRVCYVCIYNLSTKVYDTLRGTFAFAFVSRRLLFACKNICEFL